MLPYWSHHRGFNHRLEHQNHNILHSNCYVCLYDPFKTFFLFNLCYCLSFCLLYTRPEILPRIGDHVVVRSHLTGELLGELKAQWFYRILHALLGSLNNTMTIVVKTSLKILICILSIFITSIWSLSIYQM